MMFLNLQLLIHHYGPVLLFSLPNMENNLISTHTSEQSVTFESSFITLLALLIPMVISCLFLIPQLSFYHVAAFYELSFLVICIDILVSAYLTGVFAGPLFVLFIISLTTLESVILLSYLVYRSTKTNVNSLRDVI